MSIGGAASNDGTDYWTAPREQILALQPNDFPVVRAVPTRWRDNDVYGHVNNALYYEFFDTAINSWLLEQPSAVRVGGSTGMYVAESACRYLSEISYPETLQVGHRVAHLGTSSVTYELGIFSGVTKKIAALGRWVHVNVDSETRKPTPLSETHRTLLESVQG